MDRRDFNKIAGSFAVITSTPALSIGDQPEKVVSETSLFSSGERMRVPVRISANAKFEIRFFSRSKSTDQAFAWVTILHTSGNATVFSSDGSSSPIGEQRIQNGILVIDVYSDSSRPSKLEIRSGPNGFAGELFVEFA